MRGTGSDNGTGGHQLAAILRFSIFGPALILPSRAHWKNKGKEVYQGELTGDVVTKDKVLAVLRRDIKDL